MCFSATASFAASAALVPAGIYCVRVALRKNRRYLPLAFVPMVFAVQQFTEGLVWLGFGRDDVALVEGGSIAYLFFAVAFWPFWMPLCFLCTEKRRGTTWLLGIMTLVSLAWTWLYLPVFLKPHEALTTEITHHSIRYALGKIQAYEAAPPWAWRLGYLILVATPLVIGCTRDEVNRSGKVASYLGAAALLASFALCYYLYWEVFVSLWCFLAAILSLVLCYIFHRLPEHRDMAWQPWSPEAAVGDPIAGR
jgi:hypothetical protein